MEEVSNGTGKYCTVEDIDKEIEFLMSVRKQLMDQGESEGLYIKYTVINNKTCKAENAVFVMKPEKDLAAREAIKVYAQCTKNSILGKDLQDWIRGFEDLACISPRRKWCEIQGSPICCAHCHDRNICFDEGGPMCYYVHCGDVMNIEDCQEDGNI